MRLNLSKRLQVVSKIGLYDSPPLFEGGGGGGGGGAANADQVQAAMTAALFCPII